ncbi:hypothetical protein QT713_22850, partial [Xanthomonas citri pv. citri]
MRAPSSTAWPTKRLISQEEMWGNLRSRILFFLDYRYFDSNGAVLVVINYLLACSTFGLLAWCALQRD